MPNPRSVIERARNVLRDGNCHTLAAELDALLREMGEPHPDTLRLDWLERLNDKRCVWVDSQHINRESVAFAEEGPYRWSVGGQGIGNAGIGKTVRDAIDAARGVTLPTREDAPDRESAWEKTVAQSDLTIAQMEVRLRQFEAKEALAAPAGVSRDERTPSCRCGNTRLVNGWGHLPACPYAPPPVATTEEPK